MQLRSFNEIFDGFSLKKDKLSILFGNGFSQALCSDIFNYKSLFQDADFGPRNTIIRKLFKKLETYDFEEVMGALKNAEFICNSYGIESEKIDMIRKDQDTLKNSLIKVISSKHPEKSSSVEAEKYKCAKKFIRQFEKIFTLNYDLLLYWIINKKEIEPKNYNTNDGFKYSSFERPEKQKLFFLHGGLHIYNDGGLVKKLIFNEGSDISIIEQVGKSLDEGKFPLFVSEPTYEKKLERIRHNHYLNNCYDALGNINGTLFIHGHSIANNDKHIFDKIINSEVDRVFISIYGGENSNDEVIERAKIIFENKKIDFYDAETAPIWSPTKA
ncbi:DUF4917 family protein, partial [Serratia symbiotica]|uniref:DUF4917 family protein n=1 Tax=Serratia symbiotica TaxID=138074 RepID=UPI0018870D13